MRAGKAPSCMAQAAEPVLANRRAAGLWPELHPDMERIGKQPN
jgi:hypothetical protein